MNIIKTVTQNTVTRLALLALVLSAGAFGFGGAAHADDGIGTQAPQSVHEDKKDKGEKPCKDEFREIPGQGPSCRVDGGLWKVKLADGRTVLTHGPDNDLHAFNGARGIFSPNAVARQPVCGGANYMVAIIALPSDVVGNKTIDSFRQDIKLANGIFFHAAVESGSANGAHFRFACDAAGQIRVDVVRLPTSSVNDSWGTILSDLSAKGYSKTNEKYVVHYDAEIRPNGPGGEGSANPTETDSGTNPTNTGPDYAINYDRGVDILLHEIGHTLGAVNYNAPYTTGTGGHCWESFDIMCYNDDGDKDPNPDFLRNNCPDFDHFDCNHDTYFDAKIGVGQGGVAGSYIDRNWNIGECYVKWVVNYACTTDTTAPAVPVPAQSFVAGYALGATVVPVRLSWSASDPSGIVKYELQRLTISPIGAVGWVDEALSTPAATSKMVNTLGTPTFRVRAQDGAGNWSAFKEFTFTVDAHDDNSASISYSTGHWTRPAWGSAFGGYLKVASAANASATFTFTGRNVALVSTKSTNRGQAYIYVDGAFAQTLDLYSATTVAKPMVFTRGWSTAGTHTIKVVVVGTAGRPSVDVDAFTVIR